MHYQLLKGKNKYIIVILCCCDFGTWQSCIFQPSLQSSVLRDPPEIILIYWFASQETFLLIIIIIINVWKHYVHFFGNHDTFFQDSFQVQKNSNFVCILHILHIAKLIGFHESWTPLEAGFTWKALFLGKTKSRRFQGHYGYGTLCTDGQMFFIDAQDVLRQIILVNMIFRF